LPAVHEGAKMNYTQGLASVSDVGHTSDGAHLPRDWRQPERANADAERSEMELGWRGSLILCYGAFRFSLYHPGTFLPCNGTYRIVLDPGILGGIDGFGAAAIVSTLCCAVLMKRYVQSQTSGSTGQSYDAVGWGRLARAWHHMWSRIVVAGHSWWAANYVISMVRRSGRTRGCGA